MMSFPGIVHATAYSPNRQYLAVAIKDGPILILNATTMVEEGNISTPQAWISPSSLSWGPNSNKLGAGYAGGVVAVWHAPGGAFDWAKGSLINDVRGVSWSPDGRFLAAGIVHAIYVYTSAGNLNATILTQYGGSQPAGLSWSQDSEFIATGQQAYSPQGAILAVFNANGWGPSLQWRWDGPLMDNVAFEGRARFLAVQLGASRVEAWEVRNWTMYANLSTTSGVEHFAWTWDGSRMAMLETEPSAAPDTVEPLAGFEVVHLGGGAGNSSALAISPDGARVAVGYLDGTLRVLGIGGSRFFDDRSALEATTGEDTSFSVRYGGPGAARVVWRDASGARSGSVPLTLSSGAFVATFIVPSDWTGPIFYHFEAPGDSVSSPERLVRVADNDAPWLEGYTFTRSGASGEVGTAAIVVKDNIAIANSSVVVTVDGVVASTAAASGGDTLNFSLSVPISPTNRSARVDVAATDTSRNGGSLFTDMISLDDLARPTFGADLSLPGTAGGRIQLGIEARDERGTPTVTLTWRELFPTSESAWYAVVLGVPAIGSHAYLGTFPVSEATVGVEYLFAADDAAGNHNATEVRLQPVSDVVPPQILFDASDINATQGVPFHIVVLARDNIGIVGVVALLQQDGGPYVQVSLSFVPGSDPSRFEGWFNVGANAQRLNYEFTVLDEEGNTVSSGVRQVPVLDRTPPSIQLLTSILRVESGRDFTLNVRVRDISKVEELTVYFSHTCAAPYFTYDARAAAAAADVSFAVALSDLNISTAGDARPICFFFFARDGALNGAQNGSALDPFRIEVLDVKDPTAAFSTAGALEVGVLISFDGAASTDDIGVVSWNWTVDGQPAGNRTAIAWLFNTSGPHNVVLTVSDAAGHEASVDQQVNVLPEVIAPISTGGSLWVGVGIALAGIAGAAAVLLLRRRPKQPMEPKA
jgi:hypothetical protein